MYESDVENPQSTDLVDEQLDGIAGGIMDLLDDTDPDSSGVAEVKPPDPAAETEEGETEEEAEPEAKPDEPEKYTIKWQGQEKEVTQAELLDLAQKGFDYTKKTQTLAEERDQLAPFMGLAKKIQSDPVLASTISAYLSGQPTQEQQAQKPPQFDDPIEQLKWETRQEVMAEVRKELQQAITPIARQSALDRVKMQVQADPDYREVHQAIVDMVKAQPQAIQKALYFQLDQNPQAYMEPFNQIKQTMAKKPESKPTPVKKETHAPILEAGGVSPPDGIAAKEKAARLSKQKAKALRSGDNFELANWLQESGALEHLY
jgi:hypothetical protein